MLREVENLAASSQGGDATDTQRASQSDSPMSVLDRNMREDNAKAAKDAVLSSIVNRVADILFTAADTLDPSLGVSTYGIDSLVAAELKSWLITTYKSSIPFLKLLDPRTSILDLADIVLRDWKERNN